MATAPTAPDAPLSPSVREALAAIRSPAYEALRLFEVRTHADFLALPVLRKADLKRGFPDRFLPPGKSLDGLLAADRLLRVHSSSGTTDERVDVLYDDRLNAFPAEAKARWAASRPLGVFSKIAVLTSPICAGFQCHLDQKTFTERIRGRTLTCFVPANVMAARPEHARQFNDELTRFAPDVLLVNPVYAVWLARLLLEQGITPWRPAVILSSYQWLLPSQRAFLRRAFSAEVYDYYSATDLGGAIIAYETPAGGLTVNSSDVFVETVSCPPLPESGWGWLAVTTLKNRHMPLVRYLVGDLARPVEADGPALTRFELGGRGQETFVLGDAAVVTPRDVSGCVRPDDDVAALQVEEVGHQKLEARVVPLSARTVDPGLVARLRALFPGWSLQAKAVDRIELQRSLKTALCLPRAPLSRVLSGLPPEASGA